MIFFPFYLIPVHTITPCQCPVHRPTYAEAYIPGYRPMISIYDISALSLSLSLYHFFPLIFPRFPFPAPGQLEPPSHKTKIYFSYAAQYTF
jgi:hypothetical protein